MRAGDHYRIRAVEFDAKAKVDTHPGIRVEFVSLARWYRRLADQADRNSQLDLVYETPPPPPRSKGQSEPNSF
jgi:hypothetical protein